MSDPYEPASGLAPFLGVPRAAVSTVARRSGAGRKADNDDDDNATVEEKFEGAPDDPEENYGKPRKGKRKKAKQRNVDDEVSDEADDASEKCECDDDDEDCECDEDEDEVDEEARRVSAAAGLAAGGRGDRRHQIAFRKASRRIAARAKAKERKRMKRIMSHPSAAANIELATKLAFATGMSSKQAIAVLAGMPRSSGLSVRMAMAGIPRIGVGGDYDNPKQLVAQRDAARKAAMGIK